MHGKDAMHEQNRLRLDRIAARLAKHAAQAPSDPLPARETQTDAAFLAAFSQVRDAVLRPLMGEVGLQLKEAGYSFRISAGNEEGSPSVDLHIMLPERSASKDTIRFLARKDAVRGWQVIAELELKRSPFELTRFEKTEEITHDVAEQLVVDAVEQMFASTPGTPGTEPHGRDLGALEPKPADGDVASVADLLPAASPDPAPPAAPDLILAGSPRAAATTSASLAGTEMPTFLRSRHSPFAETSLSLDLRIRPALPFARSTGDTPPPPPSSSRSSDSNAALPPATRPRIKASPPFTGTVDAIRVPVPVLPFAQKAAGEPPSLTLEEYASLRANLMVKGEEDPGTWKRFGIASQAMKEALQVRFASRFRDDPGARVRFLELVERLMNELRAETPGA
jgi:hypothetical protein